MLVVPMCLYQEGGGWYRYQARVSHVVLHQSESPQRGFGSAEYQALQDVRFLHVSTHTILVATDRFKYFSQLCLLRITQ